MLFGVVVVVVVGVAVGWCVMFVVERCLLLVVCWLVCVVFVFRCLICVV